MEDPKTNAMAAADAEFDLEADGEEIAGGMVRLRKSPKEHIENKVQEAAKILDIDHMLDRKPKALSGGQRQRIAIGRTTVRDPKVF